MGKNFFDTWSIFHFICGFLSTSTLIPSQPYLSAVITNILHFFMEIIEKNKNPYTNEILETNINHLGDIIFFFIGSILAILYGHKLFIKQTFARYFFLIIMILIFLQEMFREIFPRNWIFDSAYS
jgi:hypothetical protein